MIKLDKDFEQACGEHLAYLYSLVEYRYRDCREPDALVQDTLAALVCKVGRGERVAHPKGFLSTVMKNKYNARLREQYRAQLLEYTDGIVGLEDSMLEEVEEKAERDAEYEAVRREVGRLIYIYREVAVRHYFHGQSVDAIAAELKIPRGTVLSRLSAAREQIREGIKNMEKYSQISYEPMSASSIGIFGSPGIGGEPFSLLRSNIEANILYLAYENPVSVRGIADTMGRPSAYIEPIIDTLVGGELLGKTASGLVYTRCFVLPYERSFGDIPFQEQLAKDLAVRVWAVAWRCFEPLTKLPAFSEMTDKQKGIMLLASLNRILGRVVHQSRPDVETLAVTPPERPNGGRWLATVTLYAHGQKHDSRYECSGPVNVGYSKEGDGSYDCQMFDCQSLFGDAHGAYNRLKYHCNLQSILRFYASFLPCDVKCDVEQLYELIPNFEELGILARHEDGTARLDIPALPFDEVTEFWNPACYALERELLALLGGELQRGWRIAKNRVPNHVDSGEYFAYAGVMGAYAMAQLLAILDAGIFPYPVEIGKSPLIYIVYRKRDK